MGEANTGMLPTTALSALSEDHCIAISSVPTPGSPGMPEVNVASKMKEFPPVFPMAFEMDRAVPPPVSPGFFQMYLDTGPDVGESPQ